MGVKYWMTEVLELALLGRMRMNLGGKPFDSALKSSKAKALLCYLLVTGRPQPRHVAAALLWPQIPQQDARRNLRGVVMNLRQIVGSHLLITNHSLAIDPESTYWLDVDHFKSKLELPPGREPVPAALGDALALYRGEFMEDLYSGHDSGRWQPTPVADWQPISWAFESTEPQ